MGTHRAETASTRRRAPEHRTTAAPGPRRARREAERAATSSWPRWTTSSQHQVDVLVAATHTSTVTRRPLATLPFLGVVGALGITAVVGTLAVQQWVPASADAAERGSFDAFTAGTDPVEDGGGASQALRASRVAGDVPNAEPLRGSAMPALAPTPEQAAARAAAQAEGQRLEAERASRERARNPLDGCDGVYSGSDAGNGRLQGEDLCRLWDRNHLLRPDAAVAAARLNAAYRAEFGGDICVTDSYRSYSSQVSLRARKGGLAAAPGTSEHGWGLALDLCDGVERGYGERFSWLDEHAPDFGWDNPEWARPGGSGSEEPWHWEYFHGVE